MPNENQNNLENGLTRIEAGKTVKNFLNDINDNFSKVQPKIENAPDKIHISTDIPADNLGQNGDIWIVYEE